MFYVMQIASISKNLNRSYNSDVEKLRIKDMCTFKSVNLLRK